jgi:hypothetical protein
MMNAQRWRRIRKILKREFADCDFTGAQMADCLMDGPFVRCNFTAANLCWAQPHEATFTGFTYVQSALVEMRANWMRTEDRGRDTFGIERSGCEVERGSCETRAWLLPNFLPARTA